MKNLQITADWILCNFSHSASCKGDGTVSIFCDPDDIKWNTLALDGISYEYGEDEINEIGELEAEFYFRLIDIKKLAPKFYKKMMEINDANSEK
jgi:hypothetical protein